MRQLSRDETLQLTAIMDRNLGDVLVLLKNLINNMNGSLVDRRDLGLFLADRMVADTADDMLKHGMRPEDVAVSIDAMRERFYLGLLETK